MTARGRDPVRPRSATSSRVPEAAESGEPDAADAAPASGTFVALTGLAVAAGAGRPEQLRSGLRALQVRPKLLVGQADDPAEVAADALADAVVHRLQQPDGPGTTTPDVLGALRRVPASPPAPTGGRPGTGIGPAGGEVDDATEQALRAAGRSGSPLAPALRRQYEDAFDADFSAVRVHSGPASAGLNAALGARAFTLGSDIYFGDRVPDSASATDRHLLAHELAHTLQDGGTAHRAVLRRLAVQLTASRGAREEDARTDDDVVFERDAAFEEDDKFGEDAVFEPAPDESGVDEEMLETSTTPAHHAPPVLGPPLPAPDLGPDLGPDLPGAELLALPPAPDEEPADELYVETVAIVGRPAPLFSGSMGDHMTAYVVSRKGVENAVVGQPFAVAVRELKDMVAQLKKLPGWNLVDALKPAEVDAGPSDTVMEEKAPESPAVGSVDAPVSTAHRRATHHARFVAAEKLLDTCQALVDSADTDDLKIVRLQDYIAAYLELRELVPLSVSDWKNASRSRGGKGDGESGLPGFLAEPETQPPGQLRRDFVSTIATYRIAQAAVEPNAEALATLMPGLDPLLDADQRTDLMTRQHVQSVLSNFPQNFAPLAEDILYCEGRARSRAAEKAKAERDWAKQLERGRKKTATKRKAEVSSSSSESDDDIVEEAKETEGEATKPERTEDENFAIIQNHLIRLVKMRYAEVARVELAYQQDIVRLHPDDEMGATARRDAKALTSFLAKGSEATGSTDEESKATKRTRGSETDVVDDVYGTLSAKEAKLVYTGRDTYAGTRKQGSSGADLAVQVVLDKTGAVRDAVVERQGRYTKGAHTIPWMQWLIWLTDDIKNKQPAAALAAFENITRPKVRKILYGAPTDLVATGALPMDTTPTDTLPLDTLPLETVPLETMPGSALVDAPGGIDEFEEESKQADKEAEPDALPEGSLPLIELQIAIAEMLDEITDAPHSAVLDATDTGGKAEAHYRTELAAYQRGERLLSPEQLLNYLLALCDVGEADTDLAQRTVQTVLDTAQTDYPKAYADSGIAAFEVADLADRASLGKEGAYESEPDEESESESDEEKRPKKKQKKKRSSSLSTSR